MKKSPSLHVLIVDDEALIRWSLAETLADLGHTISEAADGSSALRAVREEQPFDVIFLDYRLPDSNDLELLAAIRRLSPQSAVIMMTAFGTPEVTRGAIDLGAHTIVSKPFEVHDMPALMLAAHAEASNRSLPKL